MRRSGRPTIRDVAEQAGVGIATVDRVLNRRAPVSESTRFTFIGVDAYLQDIVKGIIIVAAVTAGPVPPAAPKEGVSAAE